VSVKRISVSVPTAVKVKDCAVGVLLVVIEADAESISVVPPD